VRIERLLLPVAMAQTLLGGAVLLRMLRTAGGERIQPEPAEKQDDGLRISVLVPVLNEYARLAPCLEGLMTQGPEVAEILVVDGGSSDGTQALVDLYASRDTRIRLVDASPVPADWNGKAWGLQVGLQSAAPQVDWLLTVDADVRPQAGLTSALLAKARHADLPALSVATLQEIEGMGEGLLHPALLTTLVYRFGLPGKPIQRVEEVQANGQCFLFRRDALEAVGGFVGTRNSVCEDITIARALVAAGYPVGFYEAGALVSVNMYANWRETWRNWPRSLPMRDRFSGVAALRGWLEIALVQALPLPLLFLLLVIRARSTLLVALNAALVAARVGVLFGTARAYRKRPWSYWLSPLCDVPVAVALGQSALQRRHIWRNRIIVRGGS
jgi:dolichol-phosphate mannosyltransferase